ncbi:MAG: nuclear transport factor 2 family protein [Bacteroidales bacterium]|nr:nuclear transport factor 2 family protein [Bacteroidales bacterium]
MKPTLLLLFLFLFTSSLYSQVAPSSALFRTLKAQDSLLFEVGFNNCDITQFENLVSDDFEFYHDKSGITATKADFIAGIRDGLCKMDYKARRELVENSLEVYPMENKGVLYGVIQTGSHRFYEVKDVKPDQLTSIAKFTHVWLLENGSWKLSRGLSYDHISSK